MKKSASGLIFVLQLDDNLVKVKVENVYVYIEFEAAT